MRRSVALASAVLVVGAGAGVWFATRHDSDTATAGMQAQTTTAEITQRDLVIYDETTATLGFTTSVTVSSPVAGTVTSVIAAGDHIDPGTVVATIDGAPVVALIGDVPSYRDLSTSSSDGIDIRQLETNLVMLGFDPDGEIAIDEEYDSATKAAVTRWEDSLGLDGDGEITQGEIVFIPGHLLVDTVSVSVGAAVGSGGALLVGRETERSFLVAATGADGGAITSVAAVGTPVVTGTVLFWQNGHPVVAIEGDASTTPALTRDLSTDADNGVDVKLLEAMLVAGGFDPESAVVVDDEFDDATAAAVQRWWESLGIAADAADITVPAGSFVVVPGGLFASTALVADGTVPTGDAVVLSLTTAAREVTTSAPIGDETFALGAAIDVEFPDRTVSTGTVVDVGTVAVSADNVPGSTPTVTITLHVADIPSTVDDFVQIPVTLRVISEEVKDAFVVPVSALVALAEGGYGVEIATGDGTSSTTGETATPTSLIAVEPGLFADGFVSITGDQVKAGLHVVVPS
jgi:peptidoglycan hydrolase-like protein with peptidoglycan-binding domain